MNTPCSKCGLIKPDAEYRFKAGRRYSRCRECERQYQRDWYHKDPDKVRKQKRESAARKRAENPELYREIRRKYHAENREHQTEQMRLYAKRRFFWNRARGLTGAGKATTKQVASLWRKQRGLCALTGRKLDRDAQLDHRLPRARGGGDEISNLRWVCKEVNLAKRDLTDDEFYHLCADMMMWAGLQLEGAM